MLEELDKLIIFIREKYNNLLEEWNNDIRYEKIDLKRTQVRKINDNNKILDLMFNYRAFINERFLELNIEVKKLELKNKVEARVKLRNSIEYKSINYIKNHENGKIPMNKCFNDIYGIRIVFD